MSYAAITRDDPNLVKRWVQRRRLADALVRATGESAPRRVVDYGGGDGELAARAAARWPQAEVLCFEPWDEMARQAERRLAGAANARVVRDEAGLAPGADLVLCTEVFEHLPEAETARALDEIDRVLRPGGRLVVGVPVEVGPVALLKGAFRALRRPGDFDGRWPGILAAARGRPPAARFTAELAPGRFYHPHHLGFDHRRLRRALQARFGPVRLSGSPLPFAPVLLNSEAYMTVTKPEGISP